MESKECTKCNRVLPLTEFHFRKREGKDTRTRTPKKRGTCKDCQKVYRKEWAKDNPGYRYRNHLMYKYGLSEDTYGLKYKAQNGKCEICKDKPIQVVDHEHHVGFVRDLLCARCNALLGFIENTPELVDECSTYLKKWEY